MRPEYRRCSLRFVREPASATARGSAIILVVGLLEVLGGTYGIVVLRDVFSNLWRVEISRVTVASLTLAVAIGGVFLLGAVAGLLLIQRKRLGVLLSVLIQSIQVFRVTAYGAVYRIVLGGDVTLQLYPGLRLDAHLGSTAAVWFGGQDAHGSIAINLLAVGAVIALVALWRIEMLDDRADAERNSH